MKGRAVVDSTETSSLALCNNKCTWSSFEVADDHRDRAARRLRAHYSTDHPNVPLPRHVDQLGVVFWDCLPEGPVRAEFRTGTGGPEARARMLSASVTPSVASKVVTVLAAMEADLLNPRDVSSLAAAYRAARRPRAHNSTARRSIAPPRLLNRLGVVFWERLPEGPVRAEFRTGTGGPEARARMLRAGVTPSVACKVVTVLAAMEADLLNPLDVNSLSAAYLAARPSKGIS